MKTDIAVLGGGASGLIAALCAKETNPYADVAVIEKLQRTGKKLIATGNGKCNLSNVKISEYNYHGSFDVLKVIENTPDYYELFTEKLGIMCVTGSEGREGGVYPRSNSSATVLNAIRMKLGELGVAEVCGCEITEIKQEKGGYTLISADEEIFCKKLIIASGGYAAPAFGTDGAVMRMMKNMGYRTSKICPAVAPLRVSPDKVKGLKGVRVKGRISAVSGDKILRTEKGELQFNDNNISGICVFNLAYLFSEYEGKMKLAADFLPEMTKEKLKAYLDKIKKQRSSCTLEEFLTGIFVKNLAVFLVKNSVKRPLTDIISSLNDKEINAVAENIKNYEFEVTGCSPWTNAQTTMGGIHSSCIDENMQSRLHKGIYFCGEILDIAGDCGGYNLQWAWSTGILAGTNCGKSLKGEGR